MDEPSEFSAHELSFDEDQFLDCDFCNLDGFSRNAEMDNFIEDLLRNTQACTHRHTCNPPGPDKKHTHTCYHTHTQLFVAKDENNSSANNEGAESESGSLAGKKRPAPGREANREAVKKYREKKKAHVQHLEEQVQQLRVINHHLMHRLQKQATLEAEVTRLRTFLSGISSSITNELNSTSATHSQVPITAAATKIDTATSLAPGHDCTADMAHAAAVPVACGVSMPCLRAGPEVMPAPCHISNLPSITPSNTGNITATNPGSVDEDRQNSAHLAMQADHSSCHLSFDAQVAGMEPTPVSRMPGPSIAMVQNAWGSCSHEVPLHLDDVASAMDGSHRTWKSPHVSEVGKRRGKKGAQGNRNGLSRLPAQIVKEDVSMQIAGTGMGSSVAVSTFSAALDTSVPPPP